MNRLNLHQMTIVFYFFQFFDLAIIFGLVFRLFKGNLKTRHNSFDGYVALCTIPFKYSNGRNRRNTTANSCQALPIEQIWDQFLAQRLSLQKIEIMYNLWKYFPPYHQSLPHQLSSCWSPFAFREVPSTSAQRNKHRPPSSCMWMAFPWDSYSNFVANNKWPAIVWRCSDKLFHGNRLHRFGWGICRKRNIINFSHTILAPRAYSLTCWNALTALLRNLSTIVHERQHPEYPAAPNLGHPGRPHPKNWYLAS